MKQAPAEIPVGALGLFGFQMIDSGGVVGHQADVLIVAGSDEPLFHPQTGFHEAVAVGGERVCFGGHLVQSGSGMDQEAFGVDLHRKDVVDQGTEGTDIREPHCYVIGKRELDFR